MGLVVRKAQGGAEDRIRSLVAEHAQLLEAGMSVLETSLRLGRTTIDVVALDAKRTLVLVVAGEVADEKMLVSTLDAYVWCLAFPESLQRRYPAASIAITRPPRVIFVAERIPDTFMELLERLSVVPVECQELHSPNPNQTPVPPAPPKVEAPVTPVIAAPAAPVSPGPMPAPSQRLAPAQIAAWLDAGLARQRERSVPSGSAAAVAAEPVPPASPMAAVPVTRIEPALAATATNGQANGHSNGRVSGSANGSAPIAASAPAQPLSRPARAQAMRAAEASIEPAAVNLGAPQVTESSAPQPQPEPVAQSRGTVPPAPPDAGDHPALESLKFPKGGVSRQWQDFLDQLAAANK